MKDFLFFRSFVAHNLAKVFFYVAAVLQILGYLGFIFASLIQQGIVAAIGVAVFGFLFLVLYLMITRIFAEMMIVVFEMHEELKKISQSLTESDESAPADSPSF